MHTGVLKKNFLFVLTVYSVISVLSIENGRWSLFVLCDFGIPYCFGSGPSSGPGPWRCAPFDGRFTLVGVIYTRPSLENNTIRCGSSNKQCRRSLLVYLVVPYPNAKPVVTRVGMIFHLCLPYREGIHLTQKHSFLLYFCESLCFHFSTSRLYSLKVRYGLRPPRNNLPNISNESLSLKLEDIHGGRQFVIL